MKSIISTLLLSLFFVGCQQNAELKVKNSGSTIPRNHREKLIFDYFNALKEQRYSDAYKMRLSETSEYSPNGFESFKKRHEEHHNDLQTIISIGKEKRMSGTPSNKIPNDYIYTVYSSSPNHTTLMSGNVAIHCKSDFPEECFMGYNSAFGFAP